MLIFKWMWNYSNIYIYKYKAMFIIQKVINDIVLLLITSNVFKVKFKNIFNINKISIHINVERNEIVITFCKHVFTCLNSDTCKQSFIIEYINIINVIDSPHFVVQRFYIMESWCCDCFPRYFRRGILSR